MPQKDRLQRYRDKRDFTATAEPQGADVVAAGSSRFVIQKHAARRLHYDVRFEIDGVLASWAVPKGPSYDPKEKRLAVHVEDHPLDYALFEGTIPGGEYGAGAVIVWDTGTFRNITEHKGQPVELGEAIDKGHFSVWMEGDKLKGGWSLTRTSKPGDRQETWIMIKRKDEYADPERDVTAEGASVVSGRDLDAVRGKSSTAGEGGNGKTWTRGTATWTPPMLAEVADPTKWKDDGEWVYERKFDGLRCIAVRNGDDVSLWSRNHLSFTDRFPEIVTAVRRLAVDNITVDGEIVAFEKGDFRGFGELQSHATKAVYAVFDLLHLLGQDTTGLPLEDRKNLLAQTLDDDDDISVVRELDGDVGELFANAGRQHWEGLIAKRAHSRYTSGRSADWRKLKVVASQELVIGGWTAPTGTRTDFGALLVGYYETTKDGTKHLRYAGKVGTGFTQQTLRDLGEKLREIERPTKPFIDDVKERTARWVDPIMVAAVTFSEWTRDGKLRHPSFDGLRTDKNAGDVVREQPATTG